MKTDIKKLTAIAVFAALNSCYYDGSSNTSRPSTAKTPLSDKAKQYQNRLRIQTCLGELVFKGIIPSPVQPDGQIEAIPNKISGGEFDYSEDASSDTSRFNDIGFGGMVITVNDKLKIQITDIETCERMRFNFMSVGLDADNAVRIGIPAASDLDGHMYTFNKSSPSGLIVRITSDENSFQMYSISGNFDHSRHNQTPIIEGIEVSSDGSNVTAINGAAHVAGVGLKNK